METLFLIIDVLMPLLVILLIGAMIHDWRLMMRYNRVYDLIITKRLSKRDVLTMTLVSLLSCPFTAFLAFAISRPYSPWHLPYLPFAIMSVSFGIIFVLMLIHLGLTKHFKIKFKGDT